MEKVIVVGVDFSECSLNALEHAFSMAKDAECDLKMVWVNKAKQEKSVALKSPEEAAADATKAFEDLISSIPSSRTLGFSLNFLLQRICFR